MEWLVANLYWIVPTAVATIWFLLGFTFVGEDEVGLVEKKVSFKNGENDGPISMNGEAGYQLKLKGKGLRWAPFLFAKIRPFPMVQIPPGEVGIVIAQDGESLPQGFRTAQYKEAMGDFTDVKAFLDAGGQKGVQRAVLRPGTTYPIHPVAFLVVTSKQVYGLPIDPDLSRKKLRGQLEASDFDIEPEHLKQITIGPRQVKRVNKVTGEETMVYLDQIGVVTAHEGRPIEGAEIACRLGGYDRITGMYENNAKEAEVIDHLLTPNNLKHDNYQDFEAFLTEGGRVGIQHDPLLPGTYNIHPICATVDRFPMLVVEQGEVAVIKAYTGLPATDVSGDEFKYGTLVRPGHRGIWSKSLTTGKYALNPRIYEAVIVPTSIITLNWANNDSAAHRLDRDLKPITAKSREGFVFQIDLEVQIHVSAEKAPRVISMVGSMDNLVNEVLQGAVGNHFRDKLQSMAAVEFIQDRAKVQAEAEKHIKEKLAEYEIETRGVYIQDVVFPQELVKVLNEREIANQERETYEMQKQAEEVRIAMEKARGEADMQKDLARSQVGIAIQKNRTETRVLEAEGEATYLEKTGTAKAAEVRATGLAQAEAYERQVAALGQEGTAMVNILAELAKHGIRITPDVMVNGGGDSGGGGGGGLGNGLLGLVVQNMLRSNGSSGAADDTTSTAKSGKKASKGGNAAPAAPSAVSTPQAPRAPRREAPAAVEADASDLS